MNGAPCCDVAVVGAGPAGATAAFLLARKGYDVCLIDRQAFPRPKLCAGLLTWKSVELLNRLFGESVETLKAAGIITHACSDYRIFVGAREIARGHLDFPFHFVQRTRYDHHWLKRAQAAGARVETGTGVKMVDPQRGLITMTDGRNLRAGLIIGADGVWSRVRKALPLRGNAGRHPRNLAATVEVHLPFSGETPHRNNFAALHFGFLPWGYAWDFPGPATRTVGMAALARKGPPPFLDGFRRFLNETAGETNAPAPFKGYPLPYGNFLTRPAYQRVLLIGDACGLADPLLGEGIYYAHRSAQIAARAIFAGGLQPDAASKTYQALLNRYVLRELRWILFFRTALFIGGSRRRYRGLKLFFRLLPKRLEACVQGQRSFSRLLLP